MRVLLFDIDGTLLAGAGAGKNALEEAFEALYGKPIQIPPHRLSGRTDRAIGLELIREHNLAPAHQEEAELGRMMEEYIRRLPARLDSAPGRVLPGIPDLLNRLSKQEGVAMGLLTGNLRRGAHHKLSQFGLNKYFPFGGFGDLHEDRDDVAREALAATHQALGKSVISDYQSVWVLGDTPLDIRCARAIGAKVLAVATGGHPFSELEQYQPDLLLENLSDSQAVASALLS